MTRITLPQQATPEWGNRPKGDNNGPPVEANYDPMLSMGPCRVSQERVRCGSRSVKAELQGCDLERRGGEVCSEQLVPVEWREHGDALEITVTGRTHFGAAEALFSRAMDVSKLPVIRLTARDAAQSGEGPGGEAPGTA